MDAIECALAQAADTDRDQWLKEVMDEEFFSPMATKLMLTALAVCYTGGVPAKHALMIVDGIAENLIRPLEIKKLPKEVNNAEHQDHDEG